MRAILRWFRIFKNKNIKEKKKREGEHFSNPSDRKTWPDKGEEEKIQIPQTVPQASRLQQSCEGWKPKPDFTGGRETLPSLACSASVCKAPTSLDPAPDGASHAGAIRSYLARAVGQEISADLEERLLLWKRLPLFFFHEANSKKQQLFETFREFGILK